jgi:transposase-like protein
MRVSCRTYEPTSTEFLILQEQQMEKKPKSIFKEETLSDIVQYCGSQEDLVSTFKVLQKALIEKALEGELAYHLGYKKHERSGSENNRNGYGQKTVMTNSGELEILTPRDREGSFEPQLIKKGQSQFKGFEEKIISMYARGMSMREIQEHLQEIYAIEVSPEFISNVTDKVMDEVISWQNRGLDKIYPILYLDCLVVKVKENNQITNKSLAMPKWPR